MKNFCFVINDEEDLFEFWCDGRIITDCFPCGGGEMTADIRELVYELNKFAEVPIYKKATEDDMADFKGWSY